MDWIGDVVSCFSRAIGVLAEAMNPAFEVEIDAGKTTRTYHRSYARGVRWWR